MCSLFVSCKISPAGSCRECLSSPWQPLLQAFYACKSRTSLLKFSVKLWHLFAVRHRGLFPSLSDTAEEPGPAPPVSSFAKMNRDLSPQLPQAGLPTSSCSVRISAPFRQLYLPELYFFSPGPEPYPITRSIHLPLLKGIPPLV